MKNLLNNAGMNIDFLNDCFVVESGIEISGFCPTFLSCEILK